MSYKHVVQANIFNELLLEYDKFKSSLDFYYSLQEFSLGQPDASRTGNVLDLCWGYSNIKPTSLNQSTVNPSNSAAVLTLAQNEVVVGQGITRVTNSFVTKRLNGVKINFTGLNPTNILAVAHPYKLKNVYAFGSIYLKPAAASQQSPAPPPTVEFSLLRGDIGLQASPLLIVKDISLDDVFMMVYNDVIKAAEKPDSLAIELSRVIIDIDYFDPNDATKKFIKFYFYDTRKPRGWGGFAEEILAKNLVPIVIQTYDEAVEYDILFNQNIYKLIMGWVNLSSWDNFTNFIDFWRYPSNNILLPARLKQYLQDRSLI